MSGTITELGSYRGTLKTWDQRRTLLSNRCDSDKNSLSGFFYCLQVTIVWKRQTEGNPLLDEASNLPRDTGNLFKKSLGALTPKLSPRQAYVGEEKEQIGNLLLDGGTTNGWRGAFRWFSLIPDGKMRTVVLYRLRSKGGRGIPLLVEEYVPDFMWFWIKFRF